VTFDIALRWIIVTSCKQTFKHLEGQKVRGGDIALYWKPILELYGASAAVWDHTVLPATRHR